MKKIQLTVVLPNTISTTLISVSTEDTVEKCFVLLTDNWIIDGEKNYKAQIRMEGKDTTVDDFGKKLSELGVSTNAYLLIFYGIESDYKSSTSPPKPPVVPPVLPHKEKKKRTQTDFGAKAIIFLEINEVPKKCSSCDKGEWLQERLNLNQREIKALEDSKNKVQTEKDETIKKIDKLTRKLEKKQTAEWISLFGAAMMAFGGVLSNLNSPFPAVILTISGIVVTSISIAVSHLSNDAKIN